MTLDRPQTGAASNAATKRRSTKSRSLNESDNVAVHADYQQNERTGDAREDQWEYSTGGPGTSGGGLGRPTVIRIPQYMYRIVTVGSFLLLLSYGGAIFAAPITIPLLTYSTVRRILTGWWGILNSVALVLTLAQSSWAIVYFTLGESAPAIWIIPIVITLLAIGGLIIQSLRNATRDGCG